MHLRYASVKWLLPSVTAALASPFGLCKTAEATNISPAVEYTSTQDPLKDPLPRTLGYMFALSASVTVNALGYFDDGLGNNHQVGIWDSSNGLIAYTQVLGTDPVLGHFRWGSIADVILTPGLYTIGGEYLGNGDHVPDLAV